MKFSGMGEKLEEKTVLLFETKLTLEEIEENFANVDLYDGLMNALQEVLEQERSHRDV